MYQYHTPYRSRPHRRGSYFLPFLSIIIIGLIIVFAFQIVGYFQAKKSQSLENKAAVKIAAGRAEMRIWGVEQWMTAFDGSILNEGDAIRTGPGSRVVLTLLNGSMVRIGSETEVELTKLKTKSEHDEISLALKKGEVWLKRTDKETVRTALSVTTPNLEVNSMGTIFDVANGAMQTVHVLDGKVQVVVKVSDSDGEGASSMRAAETLEVALGQEVNIGPSEVNDLKNRKPIQLLALLSDEFRNGDWYSWNRGEDGSGKVGLTVADAIAQQKDRVNETIVEEKPPVQVAEPLAAPIVVSPKESERTTKSGVVNISGTTANSTEKMEVTTYIGGKPESYFLQRYKSGSTSWSTTAAKEYGNLVPGENRLTIVAIAKDGKRSDPTELKIIYDKPIEPVDMSAPKVVSFNGTQSSETTEDTVAIEGTIGKGIVKVFVNEFALGKYVMDSGKWSYFARTSLGNLKDGENIYSVYGVDADGKKTPVTKFTITKKVKPVVEQPAPTPPPAEVPATTPPTPAPPASNETPPL